MPKIRDTSLFSFLKSPQAVLVDCIHGKAVPVYSLPFIMGAGPGVHHLIDDPELDAQHCRLERRDGALRIETCKESSVLMINGSWETGDIIMPNTDYSLHMGQSFFLLRAGNNLKNWCKQLDLDQWLLFDPLRQEYEGPFPLDHLPGLAMGLTAKLREQSVILPQGSNMGFYLEPFLRQKNFPEMEFAPSDEPLPAAAGEPLSITINSGTGALTCPFCWQRFDKGDVMHVAVHPDLRGDPVLGADAAQRFHATRFNDRGQAIDALDQTCIDIACPHCRRKLHPGFLDTPHSIYSIVGAPSSGKSYFLAVMIRMLQQTLYRRFGLVLKDADPSGNAALNAMKSRLFSASDPEEAILVKTQLEGEMYERLPLNGRMVAMPKPFIFSLVAEGESGARHSIVLYDNAGEHFEPGIDLSESPGAQHITSSKCIFFLFDPTANAEFRLRLKGHPDPQLAFTERLDQQDIILTEMEVRIKRLLGLDSNSRLDTPLVMMIGKCDVWLPLLGPEKLRDVLANDVINASAVAANSKVLREFLTGICPQVVANAESLSREVVYFPVSSLGHSPLKLEDGRIAPDPAKLNPQFVEIPILWAFSREPELLIPTVPHVSV